MKPLAEVNWLLIVEGIEHFWLVQPIESLKELVNGRILVLLRGVALLSHDNHHLDFARGVVAVDIVVAISTIDGSDTPETLCLASVDLILEKIEGGVEVHVKVQLIARGPLAKRLEEHRLVADVDDG